MIFCWKLWKLVQLNMSELGVLCDAQHAFRTVCLLHSFYFNTFIMKDEIYLADTCVCRRYVRKTEKTKLKGKKNALTEVTYYSSIHLNSSGHACDKTMIKTKRNENMKQTSHCLSDHFMSPSFTYSLFFSIPLYSLELVYVTHNCISTNDSLLLCTSLAY